MPEMADSRSADCRSRNGNVQPLGGLPFAYLRSAISVLIPRRLCVLCILPLCAACQTEERVVNYKPFLSGLPNAQTQTPPSLGPEHGPQIPSDAQPDDGVVEEADGSKRLIARSGLALMRHIARTLRDGEEQLFVDQVLCEQTRREYVERGRDAAEAFRTLKKREKDILTLFNRMPAGEQSPMVIVTPIGERMQRLKVTGMAARDLRWTGFDMVLEGARWTPLTEHGQPVVRDGKQVMKFEPSNWRLRWFVE